MDNYPDYETIEYHLIYSELIRAARHRGTVTYQELAHVVGLPLSGNHMGSRIGRLLGTVSQNEVNQKRPMLSAIAVTTAGKPGGGFFRIAREMGKLTSEDSEDEHTFWEQQCASCYQIWKQQFLKK